MLLYKVSVIGFFKNSNLIIKSRPIDYYSLLGTNSSYSRL